MSKPINYQQAAEHYNNLIWTVFSVGVAFSLWILYKIWSDKTNLGAMQFFMSILGFLVLFYCILAIESFNQKKSLMYKISKKDKENDLKQKITKLPFYRIEWISEIILFSLFSAYVYLFWFVWNNNSLVTYGKKIIFLDLPMFIVSLILLFIILINWILRPKEGKGNPIEKFRRFLFKKFIKSYDEMV